MGSDLRRNATLPRVILQFQPFRGEGPYRLVRVDDPEADRLGGERVVVERHEVDSLGGDSWAREEVGASLILQVAVLRLDDHVCNLGGRPIGVPTPEADR